ncbi:hypothetical protein COOONC_25725, partial [Cooperia oncophora]
MFFALTSPVFQLVEEDEDVSLETFDSVKCPVCEVVECDNTIQRMLRESNFTRREIISSCMRFQLGMKTVLPFTTRTLVLSHDNVDLAITAFTEAEKLTAELASGAVSALRYLNTLLQESQNGVVVRDCPCCYAPMEDVWVVFPCAHTVCTNCI